MEISSFIPDSNDIEEFLEGEAIHTELQEAICELAHSAISSKEDSDGGDGDSHSTNFMKTTDSGKKPIDHKTLQLALNIIYI